MNKSETKLGRDARLETEAQERREERHRLHMEAVKSSQDAARAAYRASGRRVARSEVTDCTVFGNYGPQACRVAAARGYSYALIHSVVGVPVVRIFHESGEDYSGEYVCDEADLVIDEQVKPSPPEKRLSKIVELEVGILNPKWIHKMADGYSLQLKDDPNDQDFVIITARVPRSTDMNIGLSYSSTGRQAAMDICSIFDGLKSPDGGG